MKNPNNPFNIKVGNDVFGSDGMKVGIVVGFDQNCLVVHRGFFFPSDYYIHNGRVARYDGGAVYLTLTLGETLAETDQSAGTAEPTIFERRLVSDSSIRLDIEIGDEVVDISGKTVATVKDIEPDYLVVKVGILRRMRYVDFRHIYSCGNGLVSLSVKGSEALSKTKPTKRTVEQLLKSESIPIGTYVYSSDGVYLGRIELLKPGQIVFMLGPGRPKWTVQAYQVKSYDEVAKRVNLTLPSTEYHLEGS